MATKHVGIFLPTGPGYFARIFAGIGEYCRGRHNWRLVGWPSNARRTEQELDRLLAGRSIDGVIAGATPFWQAMVRRTGMAFVNVEFNELVGLPMAHINHLSIGKLAADYFRRLGVRHLAMVKQRDHPPAEAKAVAFLAATAWADQPVPVYADTGDNPEAMIRWLVSLPRPVGVFAWNDEMARDVHQCCYDAGLRIPDDVLLLGADNDQTLCQFLDPPLSSIDTNIERIGYEAAALLDQMMDGGSPPRDPVVIEPIGVVARASTDMLLIDDLEVKQAVKFIRDHACQSLKVEDVLNHLMISRRSLEKRFAAALGRSPLTEIHRVIIARARELLTYTDLPIPQVAKRCGWSNANHFTTLFRKCTGQTPTAYRRQARHVSFHKYAD